MIWGFSILCDLCKSFIIHLVSLCSPPDSDPFYDILILTDVAYSISQNIAKCILSSSFSLFLINSLFPLLFQWHESFQISHKF